MRTATLDQPWSNEKTFRTGDHREKPPESHVAAGGRDKEHNAGNSVPLLPWPLSRDTPFVTALEDPNSWCKHPQE